MLSDPVDGRVDRDPSGADAAAADPRHRHAEQRARAGSGQMVQPVARLRVLDPWRWYAGHLRAHGDFAPVRYHRAAARTVRHGTLWTGPEGHDGRRGPPRGRIARTGLPLINSRFP